MSMQQLFDQLKINDDRTRIIAVVSSPMVFFDKCRDEDHAMMMANTFVCHTFLKIVEERDVFLPCLQDCYRNIQYALFRNSPKARDNLYAMRNPAFLDALLTWARTLIITVKMKHDEFTKDCRALISAETDMPVFEFYKEYESYNESRK